MWCADWHSRSVILQWPYFSMFGAKSHSPAFAPRTEALRGSQGYRNKKKGKLWPWLFSPRQSTVIHDTLNLTTPHHTTPHTSLNRYFLSLFPKTPKILCIILVLQLQQLSTFYGKTRVRMFKANFKRKVWNINEVLCCFNITGLSKILFLLI